jgi:hypothetical protein
MDAFNEHFVIALSAAGQSSSRWGHTHTSADTTTTLSLICIYIYCPPPRHSLLSFYLEMIVRSRMKRDETEKKEEVELQR